MVVDGYPNIAEVCKEVPGVGMGTFILYIYDISIYNIPPGTSRYECLYEYVRVFVK